MTLLRPGLHLARRDDRHLQVGVDPPWRLVVPDEPDVVRMLADLSAGRPTIPASPAAHRVLAALDAAGMLLDPTAATRAAAALVSVEGDDAAGAEAVRLLRTAGCEVVGPERASVALLIGPGERRRQDVDEHVRTGRPHLVATATAAGWTVGPFVVPGSTACLRCVDAHLGEHDPRRAVVVEQVAGRAHGPLDPVLVSVAAGWAVRDVLSYVEGAPPSTWSATVTIGPDLRPRHRAWSRHPHCGCSWADGLAG